HNAAFDGEFLRAWYYRLGIYLPARRLMLCTLQRALWFFSERSATTPPADFKLATLCHYFGIPFHAARAHEALAALPATRNRYPPLVHRSSGACAACLVAANHCRDASFG